MPFWKIIIVDEGMEVPGVNRDFSIKGVNCSKECGCCILVEIDESRCIVSTKMTFGHR